MNGAAAIAAARGQVYDLLATVYRRPLDAAHLEQMFSDEMRAAMSAAEIDLEAGETTESRAALLDRLAVDFTRLFHGPGEHISPYECMQLGTRDELMGPAASDVQRFMAQHGFAVAPEAHEMPDHISVELAFMAELARREASAHEAGDTATLDLVTGLQRRFLAEHLGRWADRLARKIRGEAQTPFYRAMAKLLAEFVADEQEAVAA